MADADKITIKVVPVIDQTAGKKIKLDLQKELEDVPLNATTTMELDATEANKTIEGLQTKITELETEAKVNIDAKDANKSIIDLNRSLNNVGERARSLQGIRDQFKAMQGTTLDFNDVLRATSLSFDALGKINLSSVASSIKGIGVELKAVGASAKTFSTQFKTAFSGSGLTGFTSGLKQVPSLLKTAGGGAKAFGNSMKAALGSVQLIISGLQTVVGLLQLIPGVGEGMQDLLAKLPKTLQATVSNLLGIELPEQMQKLSDATKAVQAELVAMIKSGAQLSAERKVQIEGLSSVVEDQLKLIDIEISQGKKLTDNDKARQNDLQVRLQAYNDLLGRYKEEEKAIENVNVQYSDFDAELKKLIQTEEQLNKTKISLQFDNTISGQLAEANASYDFSLQLLEKQNKEAIDYLNNLRAKDSNDNKKRNDLLIKQQKNYDQEKENLAKIHQNELNKILAQPIDPDFLRKSNADVISELNRYYQIRLQLVKGKIPEETQLLTEYNNRVLSITANQQKQLTGDINSYFDAIISKSTQYQKTVPNDLFVNTANEFAKSLGIMRDAIRGEDFNSIIEKNLNIQNMEKLLNEMYMEISNFGVKYKDAIGELTRTKFEGMQISEDAKRKTEEEISNLFSDIDLIIKERFDLNIDELIQIHGEEKASQMLGDALKEISEEAGERLKLLDINIDFGEITTQSIKGLSKTFTSTRTLKNEIINTKKEYNSFVKDVNRSSQFAGYASQLTQLLIQTQGVFSPKLQSTKGVDADYEKQKKILKNQLNLNLITWEDYYDQILQLELDHTEAVKKIDEENRKAKYEYYAGNMSAISSVFSDDIKRMMDAAKENMDKLVGSSQLANAVIGQGLSVTISSMLGEMADGELTVGGFFKSILKGALSALPGIAALFGLTNPWALLAVGAGIVGLIALVDSLTSDQESKYFEGGYVSGKLGKDKIKASLTDGEYVVPSDITRQHLPRLERLRHTGQWQQPGLNNTYAIENKLDNINNTIKNTERQMKIQGQVKVNSKYFSDIEWNKMRMAF